MTKPRRVFVDTDFGQMHLRIATPASVSEPPLVCLHMTPQSSRYFTNFMDAMSVDRVVVAPDYHGYGESDLPPISPSVTIQDYARTVWQALDQLQITNVDLLGHHTGSKVAVEMASQRSASVNNIVLVSALILTDDEEVSALGKYNLAAVDESGERFFKMWEAIKAYRGPRMTLEMMAASFAEAVRNGAASDWGYLAASKYNKSFGEALSDLRHQIVVINPADDLYDFTPRLGKFLQNGKVLEKPKWGHGLWDAFTEDVVETVRVALSAEQCHGLPDSTLVVNG